MAFSLRHALGKKSNPSLGKGKMGGVTPKRTGHPVRGKGTKNSRGGISRGSRGGKGGY